MPGLQAAAGKEPQEGRHPAPPTPASGGAAGAAGKIELLGLQLCGEQRKGGADGWAGVRC